MFPFKQKYEIISLADFEVSIARGETYAGLVDTIGYVYWTDEQVYFVHLNPEERLAKPRYQQISLPYFGYNKSEPIITKVFKRLNIMPKDELMRWNYDMYYQVFGVIEEMQKYTSVADATRVHKIKKMPYSVARQKDGTSAAEKAWEAFDTTTDALDAAGAIKLPKWFSVGKTAVTICNDLSNGEYLNVAGTLILSFTKYGFLLDIGTAIINSEYVQTNLARDNAVEYKNAVNNHQYWLNKYNKACRAKDYKAQIRCEKEMKKCSDIASKNYDSFKRCIDKLGYKTN